MPTTVKPKHRIQVQFDAIEVPLRPPQDKGPAYQKLASPIRWIYDSDWGAYDRTQDYFSGRGPEATGKVYYGSMKLAPPLWNDPRQSLRFLWWEITYRDGTEWIAGAVLNESIEAPLDRMKGDLRVWLPGRPESFGFGAAALSDENGCTFSFGEPKPWVHPAKLAFYINQMPSGTVLPREKWFDPVACPDAQQGLSWQQPWNPVDRTGDPRYAGDSRNPGLDATLNHIPVPRWYERQTHSHYRETFYPPHVAAFLAAQKQGAQALVRKICRSLWEWSASQSGCVSPLGAGRYCDGRPNHLGFVDGSLPRAGQRYRLTDVDSAALRPFILHEGRPEIGKGGAYQFTECFGRNGIHWYSVRASQYAGQYGLPNGSDFEHGGQENLVGAALILGDPLAQRQLHHICEEHVSQIDQAFPEHSSRSTAGWLIKDLWLGYLVFHGNPEFGTDAERYREAAYKTAQRVWQDRIDETPYLCLLGVAYEKVDISQPQKDWYIGEATMQLGIALHAMCYGALLEPDVPKKRFWENLVNYIADVLMQPGVIAWEDGGILARYSSRGPAPDDGITPVSKRLQQTAPPQYNFRNVISAEGWCGPAFALAGRVTRRPAIIQLARDIYDHQKLMSESRGVGFLSSNSWSAWSMHHDQIVSFGFYTSPPGPKADTEQDVPDTQAPAWPATAANATNSW